ncbi:nucleoside-triphosphatase [bacterium]|nr:nucleoside-triphosphatase [bacterium]
MSEQFKNFLLTGEPGVGKTSIIKEVLAELDFKAAGFYSQEMKSGKARKGLQLITLDGQQAVLASINKKSTYKVGKYCVDLDVINDIAVPSLHAALSESELIVIDGIGKMETFSKKFREMTNRCLDSDIPVIGTLQNFASPFINSVTNRNDVVIIVVDGGNREDMPVNLVVLLEEMLKKRRAAAKKTKRRKRR